MQTGKLLLSRLDDGVLDDDEKDGDGEDDDDDCGDQRDWIHGEVHDVGSYEVEGA